MVTGELVMIKDFEVKRKTGKKRGRGGPERGGESEACPKSGSKTSRMKV